MPTAATADLVDPVLSGIQSNTPLAFVKSGYGFTYTPGAGTFGFIATYAVNADPQARGSSGQRSFISSEANIIRFNPTAVATLTDTPI